MSRHRWYKARWPFSMDALSARLSMAPFTFDSGEGFLVDRVRRDSIEARYVQQIVSSEEHVDPFGKRSETTRTTFEQISFVISSGNPLLELINPARGTRRFVSRLLELSDFALVLEPVSISVVDWSNRVSTEIPRRHFVSSLQIGQLRLRPGIHGKVIVTGEEDVRAALTEFIGARSGTGERLQISIPSPNVGTITLGANATANFTGSGADFLSSVRRSIAELVT